MAKRGGPGYRGIINFFDRVDESGLTSRCNLALIRHMKRRYPEGTVNIQQISRLSGIHRCHLAPCLFGQKAWKFDDFVKVAICLGMVGAIDDAIIDVTDLLIGYQSENPTKRKRMNR